MDARFDKVDSRFEKVDDRFGKVETRFGRVESRVSDLSDWKQRAAGMLIASTGLLAILGYLADAIPKWIGVVAH